ETDDVAIEAHRGFELVDEHVDVMNMTVPGVVGRAHGVLAYFSMTPGSSSRPQPGPLGRARKPSRGTKSACCLGSSCSRGSAPTGNSTNTPAGELRAS